MVFNKSPSEDWPPEVETDLLPVRTV